MFHVIRAQSVLQMGLICDVQGVGWCPCLYMWRYLPCLFFQSESINILLLVHMLVLSCNRAKNFIVCDSLKRIHTTLHE